LFDGGGAGSGFVNVQAIRAPSEDGAILTVPSFADLSTWLDRSTHPEPPEQAARAHLLRAAARYSGLELPTTTRPIFLAGHQPELFHPGVWIKNFALSHLARRHGGIAVNLIIDNDTVKTPSIKVPTTNKAVSVPFDIANGEPPWEERSVIDRELFSRFPQNLRRAFSAAPASMLLDEYWPKVLEQLEAYPKIGEAFAAARRLLERQHGCVNFEIPLSQVCEQPAFARFVFDLWADLASFIANYNDIVQKHRQTHRIRSRHHSVPDLLVDPDRIEVPFWAWRSGANRRQRLFVQVLPREFQLWAGTERWPNLPNEAGAFVAAWQSLHEQGYKIRPRALMTTLFARLRLCDLFIHGIGGAKYDELTDALIRRRFAMEPPNFLVVSGTKRLPLSVPKVTIEDLRKAKHGLRELRYNPQRYLPVSGELSELLQEKQTLIAQEPTSKPQRRDRCRRLRTINELLQRPLEGERSRREEQLRHIEEALAMRSVLQRRDYAWCLHTPELWEFLSAIADHPR
jgi:hypothetical protein